MNRTIRPLVVVVGLICIAAIGLALAAAAIGRSEFILIAAVFAMGLAQLVSMTQSREGQHTRKIRKLEARVLSLEKQLAAGEPGEAKKAEQDADDLPSGSRVAPPSPSKADNLDFYLEPIIDLSSGRTAHYRASVSLRLADGARFGMDSVKQGAERAGVGSMFELLAFVRAVPVLQRLKSRGRSVSIFAPASAASFANPKFMQRIGNLLSSEPEIAAGLVIEVSESEMARLSDEGMRGLAKLADQGICFCLSGTKGRGPEVATLADLGFRYVIMDARLIESGMGKDFVAGCRQNGIEIIAGQVDERDMLLGLPDRATFGFGPLFAAPRLVRPSQDEATGKAAAAA